MDIDERPPELHGHLCVLVGDDGAGKTSTLREIRALRPGWICTSLDPEDISLLPGLEFLGGGSAKHPRDYALAMKPYTRCLFLMTVIMLQEEYQILPGLQRGQVVVVDSYYYRLFAKELELNPRGAQLFAALPTCLTQPDLVVEVRVPLDTAFARKGGLTDLEYKGSDSLEGFKALQNAVRRRVAKLCAGVAFTRVNGEQSMADVAASVIDKVEQAVGV